MDKDVRNTCYGPFYTHVMVCIMLIDKESTVTMKCRTAIQSKFIYFNFVSKSNFGYFFMLLYTNIVAY